MKEKYSMNWLKISCYSPNSNFWKSMSIGNPAVWKTVLLGECLYVAISKCKKYSLIYEAPIPSSDNSSKNHKNLVFTQVFALPIHPYIVLWTSKYIELGGEELLTFRWNHLKLSSKQKNRGTFKALNWLFYYSKQ